MNLESDLKRALRRESPDPGFASRVMQRIEHDEPPRRPVWYRAAAASFLLAAVLGGYATHKAVEHHKGERAKEQVLEAMRIAGEKAAYARDEARSIGSQD